LAIDCDLMVRDHRRHFRHVVVFFLVFLFVRRSFMDRRFLLRSRFRLGSTLCSLLRRRYGCLFARRTSLRRLRLLGGTERAKKNKKQYSRGRQKFLHPCLADSIYAWRSRPLPSAQNCTPAHSRAWEV